MILLENPLGCHQPAGAGKRAVHHNNLRFQLTGKPYGFLAVAGFSENLDVRRVFENAPKAAAHKAMVVNEQYGDFIRHAPPPGRLALAT